MRYNGSNFNIEMPDDWQDRSIITFAAPVSPNEFAPNVVVTKEKLDGGEMTVEEYSQMHFDITKNRIAGLEILQQKYTMLSGKPAVEIVQRFSAHELNLQQLQVFILTNAEICVITCTATVVNFPQYLPRFKKMLDSLRFDS